MQINLNKEEADFILERLSGNYCTKTEMNLADKLYKRIERAKIVLILVNVSSGEHALCKIFSVFTPDC